ncbi:hypothetical protein [Streptomyces mesophilus]|uniref:hypothetical protein n=1 Tax=Streptomyces mesophilus TaxID=1775132 RepID=UPI00332CEF5B
MAQSKAGGGSGSGNGDLEKGVGALKRFQSRVDALLTELENSAAGSTKVAEQQVTRTAFSGSNLPFPEADGFFTQYNRVHKTLVKLSRSLGDQIEMLQIAVHASEVGYDNVDEDLRRRFYAIQTRVEEERERAEKEAERREQAEAPTKPKPEGPDNHGKTAGTEDWG